MNLWFFLFFCRVRFFSVKEPQAVRKRTCFFAVCRLFFNFSAFARCEDVPLALACCMTSLSCRRRSSSPVRCWSLVSLAWRSSSRSRDVRDFTVPGAENDLVLLCGVNVGCWEKTKKEILRRDGNSHGDL